MITKLDQKWNTACISLKANHNGVIMPLQGKLAPVPLSFLFSILVLRKYYPVGLYYIYLISSNLTFRFFFSKLYSFSFRQFRYIELSPETYTILNLYKGIQCDVQVPNIILSEISIWTKEKFCSHLA